MRILSLLGGAIVGAVVWLPAAAGAEGGFSRAQVGFRGPADRLWEGSVDLPACVQKQPRLLAIVAPRHRLARQERRGEVIAEFAGPAPVAASTVAQARQCAARAGDAATAPALLAGGAQGFTTFQSAFSACMAKADQPLAVGSMTLWVDSRCNW